MHGIALVYGIRWHLSGLVSTLYAYVHRDAEVIAEIERRVYKAGRGLVKDGTPEHLLTAKGLRAASYDACIKVWSDAAASSRLAFFLVLTPIW